MPWWVLPSLEHLVPSNRGFSLIETLAAIVLLEVAILGLAGALSSGERLVTRGRVATRTALQGRDLMARMARSDTVCPAPAGTRTVAGATATWLTGASPSLRQVVVVVTPSRTAVAESIATVVRCP